MLANLKRLLSACLALALFTLIGATPGIALVTDPNKIIPTRTCSEGQQVCYLRVTVNYNDPRIGSGVWFGTLPKNAYILAIDVHVTTAFNAGTTNTLTVGATSTSNEIVASGITAGSTGVTHLTSAAGLGVAITGNSTYQTALNGDVPIYVKYAQSGTAASAGVATFVITFAKNNDN